MPTRTSVHVAALGIAVATVALTAACELASTTAPEIAPRAVVHAVLNPTAAQQFVVVERTLRSSATTNGGTGTREPINGARVVIYGPRDDSAVAVQAAGSANGLYVVTSVTITNGSPGTAPPNVLRLRPGERYALRVETPLGVVTGETTVPVGGPVDAARRAFNVDRDTLRLDATGVRNAAGYQLRHEASGSARERFTTTLDAALVLPLARAAGNPDDAQWSFSFARTSVYPGVAQTFVVVAVDSNYFNYYVAGFDPFGDDTRGNSLTGGVGLFGAVAPLMSKTLDLTADVDTPIEGAWGADRNSATLPLTVSLYSSPFFPGPGYTGGVVVSGTGRTFAGRTLQAFGAINSGGVALDLIDVTGSAPPASVTGVLGGDTLVLTDARTGERVTYRRR